jgi:hypothetical protein
MKKIGQNSKVDERSFGYGATCAPNEQYGVPSFSVQLLAVRKPSAGEVPPRRVMAKLWANEDA